MLPRKLDYPPEFAAHNHAAWLECVRRDLNGAAFDQRLITHTYEGLYLQPLYTEADYPTDGNPSGFSGLQPLTRGATALGTSQTGWEIRAERAEPDIDALHKAILEDLEGGATGLLLRLDICARSGGDALDADAAHTAGADGVMIYDLEDLVFALRDVRLPAIHVALESGAAFLQGAALLSALWSKARVLPREARGSFNADPLAVLAREGELPYSIAEGYARLAELAAWNAERHPNVRAVRVGTAVYHHAGATATQDLACSIATALEYLRAMTTAGLSIERAARQIEFSYAVGTSLFLAIAKLRAARRLWARALQACGASGSAVGMHLHVRASRRVLTTRDPWINILRDTACVMAAGLGGADSVGVLPFDGALGLPSPLARRLARNTHHILMAECGVHRVCDAPGGSWYVEKLTDDLCQSAWPILQAIESRGGMARALGDGWIAAQMDASARERRCNLVTRQDAVLGVSEFPNPTESRPQPPRFDRAELLRAARQRLAAAERNGGTVSIGEASNRMPALLSAALAGASMGRLSHLAARGAERPARLETPITIHTYAEPFERLRDASDELESECGARPRAVLVAIGTPGEHLPRVNFAKSFFETGGFEVDVIEGEDDREVSIKFRARSAHIAVLCGTDAAYAERAAALAPALQAAGARTVLLAGKPGAREAQHRRAGIDAFIYLRCDAVRILSDLLRLEGAAV